MRIVGQEIEVLNAKRIEFSFWKINLHGGYSLLEVICQKEKDGGRNLYLV
jgi:hypothetical protein